MRKSECQRAIVILSLMIVTGIPLCAAPHSSGNHGLEMEYYPKQNLSGASFVTVSDDGVRLKINGNPAALGRSGNSETNYST